MGFANARPSEVMNGEGSGAVAVTGVSGQVVAENRSRCYIYLYNDSDTKMYVALGEAAVVGQGIVLAANGGNWEPPSGSVWVGAINAICQGGTGVAAKTLCYVEY